MHPVGKYSHAFLELGVPKNTRLLTQRADAGGFETGDVHMLDVTGRPTDPREAIVDARHPVVDEVVEAGVIGGDRASTTAVRGNEQPIR